MLENDEYENLPDTATTSIHMLAGASAGIAEHCIMYPLDSVKTRMQSLRPNPEATYRSVPDALIKMMRYEGILRPVRGVSAVIIGAGPAHALYFSCYEKMKRVLSGTQTGAHSPIAQAGAGALATLLHDAVMNPAEVVKQRMQVYQSPYKSVINCARHIYHQEGWRAFYRSYTTQLMMNIPFQIVHFCMYEFMQNWTNPDRVYNPTAHMISGAAAGGFASALTTPLDVCKTLLNTQETQALNELKRPSITGLANAATTVYHCCGPKGYWQGLTPRVLYSMPSTAISWSVYEFIKYFMNKRSKSNHPNINPSHMSTSSPSISHAEPINKWEMPAAAELVVVGTAVTAPVPAVNNS